MNQRTLLETLLAIFLIAPFSGALAMDKPFRFGVTAGPHALIVEMAKKVAGPAVREPMGIYSKRIKKLSELKDGAHAGRIHEPSRAGARALDE